MDIAYMATSQKEKKKERKKTQTQTQTIKQTVLCKIRNEYASLQNYLFSHYNKHSNERENVIHHRTRESS